MNPSLANRLGAWGFLRLQKWMGKRSPKDVRKIGDRLGKVAFHLTKKHRLLARENIARAFPEMTERQREQLARDTFKHLGRVMGDFMRGGKRTAEGVLAETTVQGIEHLDEVLARGKGALLVSGHFGNWERMPWVFSALGYAINIIARDANDPQMNKLVENIRSASGVKLLSKGEAALPTLRRLRANEIVCLLPDQNGGDMFLPFFGVTCGTVTGPAVLSTRSGAPLVPVYCVDLGDGRYKMWMEPALEPLEGYEPIEGLTRAVMGSLENAIRHYPDQYLWIHNRWKAAKQRGLIPDPAKGGA